MTQHLDALFVDVLASAQRVMARELGERLAEEDTSVDQWRTLRAIGAATGISMGTLAENVQIPAPSLTRLVDSLVDRALVYRRQSGTDKRRIDVHLSDNGKQLLQRLESIATDHQLLLERKFGHSHLLAIIALLEHIQSNDQNLWMALGEVT